MKSGSGRRYVMILEYVVLGRGGLEGNQSKPDGEDEPDERKEFKEMVKARYEYDDLVKDYGEVTAKVYHMKAMKYIEEKEAWSMNAETLALKWLERDHIPKLSDKKVWTVTIDGKEYVEADNNLGTELMYAGYKPVYAWPDKLFNTPICIEKDRVVILRKLKVEHLLPVFTKVLGTTVEIA